MKIDEDCPCINCITFPICNKYPLTIFHLIATCKIFSNWWYNGFGRYPKFNKLEKIYKGLKI